MIHELLSYERRSYLLYLSSQIQSTGPAIQTVKSIFDGQMSREETKSHLSSEKGGVPEGRMQRITPSDQRLYEYQFIGILCIYISYVMVCFNDTIKSLHFETIACQSYKLQRHHRPIFVAQTWGSIYQRAIYQKHLSICRSEYDSNTQKNQGGPVQANLGGASIETLSGGGQLKKKPCSCGEFRKCFFQVKEELRDV